MTEYIKLKDGREIPSDDFWIYAPTWLIRKYSEPAYVKSRPSCESCGYTVKPDWKHCPDCGGSLAFLHEGRQDGV